MCSACICLNSSSSISVYKHKVRINSELCKDAPLKMFNLNLKAMNLLLTALLQVADRTAVMNGHLRLGEPVRCAYLR
jgi:hypothetical protein